MSQTATLSPRSRTTTPAWAPQLVADLIGTIAVGFVVVATWIWARNSGILQTFV